MPQETALGLMMNLQTANSWKAIPVMQGIGLCLAGKQALPTFAASLVGKLPSVREQIKSSLYDFKSKSK